MRIYDPRVGKFLSVDPLRADYPELTPYQFASNRPIDANDLDGAESSHWDPIRKQWMMPSDAIRNPLPPGAYMPSNDAAKGGRENAQSGAIGIGIIGAAMVDAATGFNFTKGVLGLYTATQAASIVAHNKASTPEGIEEQNRIGKEAAVETGVGLLSGYVLGKVGTALARTIESSMAKRIFTNSITSRKLAEDYALATRYKGFKNINSEIGYENPYFDLYNEHAVVDITTTNAKTLSPSEFYKKLNNLSEKVEGVNDRILQIYYEEGKYTQDAVRKLQGQLDEYIKDFGLKSTYRIDAIK